MAARLVAIAGSREVAYLVVGGINAVVGLGSFWIYLHLFGDTIHYLGALVAAYATAVPIAFVLHRRFVFKVRGNVAADLSRFTVVQLGALGGNSALLSGFVEVLGVPVLPAQVLALALVVVGSYLAHRFFTFRRPPASGPPAPPTNRRAGPVVPAADGQGR